MFHWTIEKGIVIFSSANKKIFGNSLRRYTNIFSHISWYSRCMNDALIVVWSESYSTNTFCFFNTCSLQRIGKILNEGFNLLQTIEWLAVQNWGSSHKDEQDILSLNEPSLFLRSAMKISEDISESWSEGQSWIEWLLNKGGFTKRINFIFDVLSALWLSSCRDQLWCNWI